MQNMAQQHMVEVKQLVQVRYVFHAWMNLSILGPDGTLFYIDPTYLDPAHPKGIGVLERLKLLRINTTQKPLINNAVGFAVSNMFVGSQGVDGQPQGVGSGMAGGGKTNVKPDWAYPAERLTDMVYSFGRYGLTYIRSFSAESEMEDLINRSIFYHLMSGLPARTLLEDIPEYFGKESDYLPEKPPAEFNFTAMEKLQEMENKGFKLLETGQHMELTEAYAFKCENLIEEMGVSALAAHTAALDVEQEGVLPKTQQARQTGEKKSYDAADKWLMRQFPSFSMDTEAEKSNKQIVKFLGRDTDRPARARESAFEELPASLPQPQPLPDNVIAVPKDLFEDMQKRISKLENQPARQAATQPAKKRPSRAKPKPNAAQPKPPQA